MILIRLIVSNGWEIAGWLPGSTSSDSLVYQYTTDTWIYGFLLATLLVAVILYEARFLEDRNYINILTGTLCLAACGLLSIASGNGLTFLITWGIIDIFEFVVLTGIINDSSKHLIAVKSLITRILGILLFILFLVLNTSKSMGSDETVSAFGSVLLVIAAVLRMGIVPVHLPYSEEFSIRRGMGSMLRFIPVLSVFSFFSVFNGQIFSSVQYQWLILIFTICAIFGAVSWYFSRNVLVGRPYWIFAISNLALIGFLRGAKEGLSALAVVMVIGGAGLFLVSPWPKKAMLYVSLLFAGLIAIPFTPTAALSLAILGERFELANLFLLPCTALLLGGIVHHAMKAEKEQQKRDWVWLVNQIGLILLSLTPWIIELFTLKEISRYRNWGFIAVFLALFGIIIFLGFLRRRDITKISILEKKIRKRLDPIILYADKFFSFRWLERIFKVIGLFLANMINLLVRVLEGDGGILWSFLFLALLASLLITRQVP